MRGIVPILPAWAGRCFARRTVAAAATAALAIGLAVAPMTAASAAAATASSSVAAPAAAGHGASEPGSSKPGSSTPAASPSPAMAGPRRPAALPAAGKRALAAAAAKKAIAAASVPDTCSGAISPDTIYPCTTPSGTGTDTFTITVASVPDVLAIRALPASSIGAGAEPVTLTAPDGTAVNCQQPIQLYECSVGQAGTYTLAVANQGSDYTLAYTAVLAEATCPAVDPSFATPPVQDSVDAGAAGSCYSLSMPAGDVLLSSTVTQPNAITVAVYDATGNQVCVDDDGQCTLTGTGPYRVLVSSFYGEAESYTLELNDLSNPQGCAATPQLSYGQVPTAATGLCRVVTVAVAGSYQLYAPSGSDGSLGGSLYTAATSAGPPTVACSTYSGPVSCTLAAGTYYFVASSDFPPLASFGLDFIAGSESKGCVATGDTGFASGPATGTFAGPGEEICRTLPNAAGDTDYFFNQPTADGTEPQVEVVDATGAQQCQSILSYAYATCTLTGTAPFRVILYGQATGGGYQYLVQQSSSTAGCASWPQSGFGGSWGATATLTASDDVKCLVIPAGQHSASEMIDYSNIANTVDGAIYVNDPAGSQVCVGTSTSICAYKTGVTYTALLVTTNVKGDTYHLVRRDVSQSAQCATPTSTTVGGPSTSFTLTSDLDTVCYRVTAPAADKMWFSVRTLAPAPAGGPQADAVLQVTNASGTDVCRQKGTAPCMVTGSADYQLIVAADDYAGIAITTHLDSWIVGTASGWAAQCQAHNVTAANGFPVITGTLTEQATAYCAVVTMAPFQEFNLPGVETNVEYPNVANLNIWPPANWSAGPSAPAGICSENYGTFGASCSTYPPDQGFQGLLMLTLGSAQSGTGYTLQGVCKLECATPPQQATVTGVSPARAPAGPGNKIVVTGTNLSLATQFALDANGLTVATGSAVAVNPAGTQLTVLIDTSSVTPGVYDVSLDSAGYSTGTPSPGYLPGAYTVTAAAAQPPATSFTGVSPQRILDTRSGLGAKKAKVAAHGTVTVTVDGKDGIPASNVTAVAVDVTAISPTAGGSLIAYPAGAARPGTTSLTFGKGQTVTTLVIVRPDSQRITLYNASSGTLDAIADVVGYYTASTAGATLTSVGPTRILDTRSGLGAKKAQVTPHGTVSLTVEGTGGVPATGVRAVVLNVAAISPAANGSLTIFPSGISRPLTTALTFAAKNTIYGLVIAGVGSGGKIEIYNSSGGSLDLTADVVGYYGSGGSSFLPVGPQRVLDTRTGLGGSGQTVLPGAAAMVASIGNIIPTALSPTSEVLDVTVTGEQHAGTLTVLADGTSLPVATLSYAAGQNVTSLVIVPDVDGSVDFVNGSSGTIQVVADLVGYYG
ncbi:MAG TPA: hypothetical protein VMG38_26550 [Trebonia sp.]|nr:hypothetical protein [Trebonia sp.]